MPYPDGKKFEVLQAPAIPVKKVVKFIQNTEDRNGRMLHLMAQEDGNQCGVCALFNVLKLAGIETDYIDTNVEPTVFMNRIRENLGIDQKAWLSTSNLLTVLNEIFLNDDETTIGHGFNAPGGVSDEGKRNLQREIQVNINFHDCFIVNSGRHYTAIAKENDRFIKFDSLTQKLDILSPAQFENFLQGSIQYFAIKKPAKKKFQIQFRD